MSLTVLFDQLRHVRKHIDTPILLMGYLNPVEQYGFERFASDLAACGIDGAIIPDMPFELYLTRYKQSFLRHGVRPVFLVTARTADERIRAFDAEGPAFIYLLSSDAVTGGAVSISTERQDFFKRVSEMGLSRPTFVGFGVRDKQSFESVTRYTRGAIIGSGFVQALADLPALADDPKLSDLESVEIVERYVQSIR